MTLSRDPVLWRAAAAGLVNAAVSVGFLTASQAQALDNGLSALLVAVVALLPIIAGVLARFRTVPVPAGTGPVAVLERGEDDVYRPAGLNPPAGGGSFAA